MLWLGLGLLLSSGRLGLSALLGEGVSSLQVLTLGLGLLLLLSCSMAEFWSSWVLV